MTLIKTISPQKAGGDIKKGYDLFLKNGRKVPAPFRLLSASPQIFNLMIQRNRYYANHPALSNALLAHIRYFVSTKLNFEFCRAHNKNLILLQGVEEKELDDMGLDPDKSMLEKNERQMLAFVLDAMENPDLVSKKDIDILHKAGWKDGDIFDALVQAVGMMDHHILMKVFKPDFEASQRARNPSTLPGHGDVPGRVDNYFCLGMTLR